MPIDGHSFCRHIIQIMKPISMFCDIVQFSIQYEFRVLTGKGEKLTGGQGRC